MKFNTTSTTTLMFAMITIASAIGGAAAAGSTYGTSAGAGTGASNGTTAGGGSPPKTGNVGLQGYPPMDQPPPVNQPWMRKIDLSKIPNIPPRKSLTDCPPPGSPDPNCAWSCAQCQAKDDVYYCPNKGDWGLTFDDGPASSQTNQVLNFLDTTPIKATFFIVGSRVVEFPDTLKRTFNSKHQIGVHTWSHSPLTTQTTDQVIAEILWTEKIINDTLGIVPKYMRPPFGDVDNRVRAIMKALGYTVVIWNEDTGDFGAGPGTKFDPKWIVGNFTQWASRPSIDHGDCSLEHDIHTKSVSVVHQVVPILLKAGLKPQPIAQCLNDPNPYQTSVSNVVTSSNDSSGSSSGGNGSTSTGGSSPSGGSNNTDGAVNIQSNNASSLGSFLGLYSAVFLGLISAIFL